MAETPRRIEVPAGSPLAQILRDGITTAGEIREGDLIVYANPPAAPSVGEPEPPALTINDPCPDPESEGRHCSRCASKCCYCGARKIPLPPKPAPLTIDGLARLLALGATAKGTYLTAEQSAEARSSLEEARKDSERLRAGLDQARQALQSLASPTRFSLVPLIDPTTELRVRREFAEIGRAAATSALTPPRAPSPRDEP